MVPISVRAGIHCSTCNCTLGVYSDGAIERASDGAHAARDLRTMVGDHLLSQDDLGDDWVVAAERAAKYKRFPTALDGNLTGSRDDKVAAEKGARPDAAPEAHSLDLYQLILPGSQRLGCT